MLSSLIACRMSEAKQSMALLPRVNARLLNLIRSFFDEKEGLHFDRKISNTGFLQA